MTGIGLSSALRTLTRFPFPGKDPEHVSTSLYWFPVVGLLYGLCDRVILLLALPPLASAAMLIAWNAWMSRGFHLDGLCDMFDGFGGGYTRERRLEIMKDSHVGSFGIIALVIVLLCQFALYGSLIPYGMVIILSPILGRTMQVLLCVLLPYARPEGTAGELVRGAKGRHAFVACLLVALFVWWCHEPVLWVMSASAVVGVLLIGVVSWKKIGGVTGDVLGSAEVLCETFSLLGALAFLSLNGNTL